MGLVTRARKMSQRKVNDRNRLSLMSLVKMIDLSMPVESVVELAFFLLIRESSMGTAQL